jgi:hypothetical protein
MTLQSIHRFGRATPWCGRRRGTDYKYYKSEPAFYELGEAKSMLAELKVSETATGTTFLNY